MISLTVFILLLNTSDMVIHFYGTNYLSAVRFSCDCRFLTPNEFSFSSFTDIYYKVKTVFKKDVVILTIQP